ncbi:MAG: class I SAM-dependent methyltransferase [Planctomycetota bacterium]
MKICLACSARFVDPSWTCPRCKAMPRQVDGFTAFSPESSGHEGGFSAEVFARLAGVEAEHFWFRARNRLIAWALRTRFPGARTFLEIGCGTGFVLSGLSTAVPGLLLHGSEFSIAGLPYAAARVPSARLFQMDARKIPFAEEFDVIGAFDVLEHIEEDLDVLARMREATAPGGGILVTVPQHRFLWSPTDERAGHVRRYGRRDLVRKVRRAGLRVELATSFVSLLLPAMLASRLSARRTTSTRDPLAEFRLAPWKNRLFERVMDLERKLIERGVSFPAGGSLLLVARRD